MGIAHEYGEAASFADFMKAYENGQLPIRCEYNIHDVTIVEDLH